MTIQFSHDCQKSGLSFKGYADSVVRDTGSGIDPEILPKLFEKFVTKSEKGTGIGLYISKNIVEAHGGTISGENNFDGPGATCKFTLLLIEQDLEGTNARVASRELL